MSNRSPDERSDIRSIAKQDPDVALLIRATVSLNPSYETPKRRRLACKTNFDTCVRQNNPTGNSVLIYGNRVK
ncbi:hypothetical protein ABIE49_005166 [Bradyrhizobium sp. OAE829]